MAQNPAAHLRNASKKSGAPFRKKDPLLVFLKEWRFRLKREGKDWEGPLAVAELQRTGQYQFLLCQKKSKTDWRAKDLFIRILDEMKRYREEVNDRIAKEYFDDVEQFLNGLSEKIRKREEATRVSRLKALLTRLRGEVEGARKAAREFRLERGKWHFSIWQRSWPKKLRRKNLVGRKIELDVRLQVEIGKMFADYLRPQERSQRVSLGTIARLILLAYRVGGLTFEGESGTTIFGTRRHLTVKKIRDNLEDAGLPDVANFRRLQRKRRRIHR